MIYLKMFVAAWILCLGTYAVSYAGEGVSFNKFVWKVFGVAMVFAALLLVRLI